MQQATAPCWHTRAIVQQSHQHSAPPGVQGAQWKAQRRPRAGGRGGRRRRGAANTYHRILIPRQGPIGRGGAGAVTPTPHPEASRRGGAGAGAELTFAGIRLAGRGASLHTDAARSEPAQKALQQTPAKYQKAGSQTASPAKRAWQIQPGEQSHLGAAARTQHPQATPTGADAGRHPGQKGCNQAGRENATAAMKGLARGVLWRRSRFRGQTEGPH